MSPTQTASRASGWAATCSRSSTSPIRVGYHDKTNIPAALGQARKRGLLERNLDLEHASYFVSRMTITPDRRAGMGRWRKHLFVMMARNASSPISHFGLPSARTVTMGSEVTL